MGDGSRRGCRDWDRARREGPGGLGGVWDAFPVVVVLPRVVPTLRGGVWSRCLLSSESESAEMRQRPS